MNRDQWIAVDDYFTRQLISADPILDAALESNAAAGLPPIDVAPNQGKLLHLLARIQGARTILEIGTLGGYSTNLACSRLAPRWSAHHARSGAEACRGGQSQYRPCRTGISGRDQAWRRFGQPV